MYNNMPKWEKTSRNHGYRMTKPEDFRAVLNTLPTGNMDAYRNIIMPDGSIIKLKWFNHYNYINNTEDIKIIVSSENARRIYRIDEDLGNLTAVMDYLTRIFSKEIQRQIDVFERVLNERVHMTFLNNRAF